MEQKFLLMNTPAHTCRVDLRSGSGGQAVTIREETIFPFDIHETTALRSFLETVKADQQMSRVYNDPSVLMLTYEPTAHELHRFIIANPRTHRTITMGYTTAWRLLDALTGKTERLIVEE